MYGTRLEHCKVCSGTDLKQYKFGTKSGDRIVVCANCGLIFVNPIPDYESIVAAYSRLDTAIYRKEIESADSTKRESVAKMLVDNLNQQFPMYDLKDYRVLDVGCGDGSLCSNLKDMGIQVMGQEIDKEPAEMARQKGIRVTLKPLKTIKQSFHAISLIDVAEHVADPVSVFKDCFNLLHPGGLIYIHTPRKCLTELYASLPYILLGYDKIYRRLIQNRVSIFHLQLWSDKSLYIALAKARFCNIHISPRHEFSWPVSKYWHNVGFRDGTMVNLFLTKLTKAATTLHLFGRNKAIATAIKPGRKGYIS